MIQAKYCDLCEHPKRDMKNGLTCGLTGKKPNFKDTCPDILFDKQFQSKIEDINLELHKIRKNKNKAHLTFYILIIIGFLLMIGNKIYAEWMHSTTYYWVYRISAIAFGITVLTGAYDKFNRYRKKLRTAEFEKNKIDTVLEKYNISYKTSFNYKERIHGNQNIEITTEYKNWTKKHTTTTVIVHYN